MKMIANVNQIITFIKKDSVHEFIELLELPNTESFLANFCQVNQLVERKCGSQILHLLAQHNAWKICESIPFNSHISVSNNQFDILLL